MEGVAEAVVEVAVAVEAVSAVEGVVVVFAWVAERVSVAAEECRAALGQLSAEGVARWFVVERQFAAKA